MAICALPVFRGAGVRPRLSAQRPGLPSDAAALPEHGAPPEPHVPDHQCLLSGELSQPSLCAEQSIASTLVSNTSRDVFSQGLSQCLVLVHSVSHTGHLSH